jgi:hypothetical protein
LLGTSFLLHGILILLFSNDSVREGISGYVTAPQLDVFTMCAGLLTAIYVYLVINIDRYVYVMMLRKLQIIDPRTREFRRYLVPDRRTLIVLLVLFMCIISGFYRFFLLNTVNIDLLEYARVIEFDGSFWLLFYVVLPINSVAGGILLAVGSAGLYRVLIELSSQIKVDIFRVNEYTSLATVAVTIFCVGCLFLSLGGVLALLADSEEVKRFLLLVAGLILSIYFIVLLFMAYPILILVRRIAAEISREKGWIMSAIDGNMSELIDSRISADEGNLRQLDLINYLVTLNSLSPWPIGPQVKRVVLFGLLPPAAWAMAAVVENTLY